MIGLTQSAHLRMFPFISFSSSGALDGGSSGLADFLITRIVGFKTSACKGDPEALSSNYECDSITTSSSACFRDGAFAPTFFGAVEVDILFKFRSLYA